MNPHLLEDFLPRWTWPRRHGFALGVSATAAGCLERWAGSQRGVEHPSVESLSLSLCNIYIFMYMYMYIAVCAILLCMSTMAACGF